MANIKKIKINENEYDVIDATAARKGMYVGTCPSSASIGGSTVTMASSADKVVTVDPFPTDANNKPLVGTIIGVKYATSNTYKTDPDNNKPEAAHRINVNDTGFIQIYYNNAALKSGTSANTLAAGYKNRYIYYQYDGTYWAWLGAGTDTNTTYAGYSFGLGLGVQNNASASATITVTLSNYALATGGVTAVRFLYDVPANSTMNINSKGAKSIYYKNSAITAGVIKAGDTATFIYSGQYHLLSIDRWDDDIKATKPFIVTVTYDDNDDEYSADKTFAETYAAWQAGREVFLVRDTLIYHLVEIDETYLGFLTIPTDDDYRYGFYFSNDNTFEAFDWSITADCVHIGRKINNKPLSSDITLTASDVGADVFLVEITSSHSGGQTIYTSSETFSDIYDAFNNGRVVLASLDDTLILRLDYIESGSQVTFVDADSDGHTTYIVIDESDNVSYGRFDAQSSLVSGTNIKTINNNSILGSGNLTPSQLGVPSIANNLTTTTTGSALDATQGKALNDKLPFIVTLTASYNNGTATYSANKTYSEIVAAYNAERLVVLDYLGTFTTSTWYDSYENKFYFGNYWEGYSTTFMVDSSNVWSETDVTILSDWNEADSTSPKFIKNKPTIPAAQVLANWSENSILSKAYILNKPTNVSSFNNDAGYLTSHQDISGKADVVTIVTNSNTGSVTQALDPNKFYKFTGALTALTLTLTSGTGLCIYAGKFTSNSTTACTVTLPTGVKLADGAPTVEAGGTYEFNIADNLMLLVKEGT